MPVRPFRYTPDTRQYGPRIIVKRPPCSQSAAVRAYIKWLPIYDYLVSSRPMNLSQLFHPAVAKWFMGHFVQPTPAQAQAWPAIKAGRHALIAAPTGSGKTLAAFLAAIDDLVRQSVEGPLADATQVVYVSPLKALSNDIQRNLEAPLAGIRAELMRLGLQAPAIRAMVRTGDTTQTERAMMRRTPPHILVTTPE